MTDPIADMLTRVRNANQAYHETATIPHSKIKVEIAEILTNEGYIAGYTVNEPAEGQVGKTLSITLKYGQNRERSLAGVRRISKPGLRVYAKSTGLPKVLGGLGIAIFTKTPSKTIRVVDAPTGEIPDDPPRARPLLRGRGRPAPRDLGTAR